jgi:hypothetical protein
LTPQVPAAVERPLNRLAPGDPARQMVELVFEFEDPAVTSAVVRKLLAEIRAERSA